ncbi:MAG: hypothetical protein A2218_10360 [Elusimicrobia bacterium RIFOXYA2_FULL_53_38]|nr:MAG: hypothetical protein A2218_10360 [Elusimicrobia bacterium RIFOXYA2_FULL_53_38]
MIEKRLLNDNITIRKPVQSMVPGTRQPVYDYEVLATGIKARFDPGGTPSSRNVMGQTPKRTFRLFLNPTELKANYEIIRESDGEVFIATDVKNFWGHHLEATVEEKK